ncbi:glycosyltransferase family 2 protein [Synechocystis sp. LKSZ1]|uniref:glycosyltransferase family 2 protein n=1 Tax=Synechocystis sp. LKSZ1 TaxID=3144951 RepID=UPI00336C0FE9
MTDLPLLSICIPAYNRPVWLRRGLESIAESAGVGIEVVITDDSDTDQGRDIAAEVFAGWSGVWRYEHHERPLGMAQNWNRAIQWATGRYVVILHDDDFFVAGGLDRLVAQLRGLANQYPVMLFGVRVVDEQERVMKRQVFAQDRYLSPQEALMRLFSNSSFVRFPGMVIQRPVFTEVGFFNPDWREPCDLEMWMRLFSCYGVYCCQEVTVAYRVHSQALTMGSFHRETVKILLALFGELEKLNILATAEISRCKGAFFHQYVLSGAWRQLQRGRWRQFQEVMGLLELPALRGLDCPLRWRFLKGVFSVFAQVLKG